MEQQPEVEKYSKLKKEIDSLFNEYKDSPLSYIAKLSSVTAILYNGMKNIKFLGFYLVVNKLDKNKSLTSEKILEIGPYMMDDYAVPRISIGKGVCGTAWKTRKTQIIPDVMKIENYIACDCQTKSEVVIPMFQDNDTTKDVIAVFDIDSPVVDFFQKEEIDIFNYAITAVLK